MHKKIIIIGIFIFLFLSPFGCAQGEVKKAEFAGSWYPSGVPTLKQMLNEFLKRADIGPLSGEILGVVTPHAGYIYSAPVAAYSFRAVEGRKFDTVILMGPSHRYYFEGVSIYPRGYFQTPLGNLRVNHTLAEEFGSLDFVSFQQRYFEGEHSLEVELPFVRKVLGRVKIVPVLFGQVSYKQMGQLAQKLTTIARRQKILIVVSTDLSHFHPYSEAVEIDRTTVRLIKESDTHALWKTRTWRGGRACGILPLITFLKYSRMRGATVKILKYANSGDTAGGKRKVVGYVSAVAYVSGHTSHKEEEKMEEYTLNEKEKIELLRIARETLTSRLQGKGIPEFKVDSSVLSASRGAFVTLKKKGELRGCIGRIVADKPLYKVVSEMASAAALEDNRFRNVTFQELPEIEIEISVLTPFTKVKDIDEIEVGTHGLMIRKGFNSGLLLPQVPVEQGWGRQMFLEHTCLKAWLPQNAYKDKDATLYKFSAIVFSESELLEQ